MWLFNLLGLWCVLTSAIAPEGKSRTFIFFLLQSSNTYLPSNDIHVCALLGSPNSGPAALRIVSCFFFSCHPVGLLLLTFCQSPIRVLWCCVRTGFLHPSYWFRNISSPSMPISPLFLFRQVSIVVYCVAFPPKMLYYPGTHATFFQNRCYWGLSALLFFKPHSHPHNPRGPMV